MEVFYNELSNYPLAASRSEARDKIIGLLRTLKALQKEGFNIMRTHQGFYADPVAADYSFADFFGDDTVSNILKILLRSISAQPFIKDGDSYETEVFVTHRFNTSDYQGNLVEPEGLAAAYIFNSPSVSISDGANWAIEAITIRVTNTDDAIDENIPNLWCEHIYTAAFTGWKDSLTVEVELDSEDNIYTLFPRQQYEFETRAIDDLLFWYHDDKRYLVRIKSLINDISTNPFSGGIGHTETLGGTNGRASKRIVKKDRIVYTYTKEKITIHQCKGHYDDK